MYKEISQLKEKDWSLNLEDPYYEDKPDEMIRESIEAIKLTQPGCYVNLVTPGKNGDPVSWLMPILTEKLKAEGIVPRDILYIAECGCGGHVTRVYR